MIEMALGATGSCGGDCDRRRAGIRAAQKEKRGAGGNQEEWLAAPAQPEKRGAAQPFAWLARQRPHSARLASARLPNPCRPCRSLSLSRFCGGIPCRPGSLRVGCRNMGICRERGFYLAFLPP